MKKVYNYLGMLLVLTILLSTTLIVAQTNFEVVGERFGAIDVIGNFDLGTKSSSILLGILLFMILQSVLVKMELFGDSRGVSIGVALIVTVLTFIYVPDNLFDALATNYAALGATILTVLPFLIATYYTVWITDQLSIARSIWAVFFLYYLIILIVSWGTATSNDFSFLDPINLSYAVALIASLVLFFFMGPIRKLVWTQTVASTKEKITKRADLLDAALTAGEEITEAAAGK